MTYDEVVAHRERSSLVGTEVIEVVRLAGEGCLNMVHKRFCDRLHICRSDEGAD